MKFWPIRLFSQQWHSISTFQFPGGMVPVSSWMGSCSNINYYSIRLHTPAFSRATHGHGLLADGCLDTSLITTSLYRWESKVSFQLQVHMS